jgi:hypothetical protein
MTAEEAIRRGMGSFRSEEYLPIRSSIALPSRSAQG